MKTGTRFMLKRVLALLALAPASALALVKVPVGEACAMYLPSAAKTGGEYRWEGACPNGLASGPGRLRFFRQGSEDGQDSGTAHDGVRTGAWLRHEQGGAFKYALSMKDGVADGGSVREFPMGSRDKALARAETLVALEKYAEKVNSPGLPARDTLPASTTAAQPAQPSSASPSNGPTKEQYLAAFPRQNAIVVRFGNADAEHFWVVDPGEGFSRRLLRQLFAEGSAKLTGVVYLHLYPLGGVHGDLGGRAAAYVYCGDGGDRLSRLKQTLQENFDPPAVQASCNLDAVESNKKVKLSGTPSGFVDGRFYVGIPDKVMDRMASAEPVPSGGPSVSVAASALGAPPAPGQCKPNLQHIGVWLERGVRAPEVQQMMEAIQAQDVRDAMRRARAQGLTPTAMINATQDQALQFDRVARESSQCAADTDAFGTTDEQFLKQAPMRLPSNCSGIRNACICSLAINRMSAIAARELARQMRCFAGLQP